MEFPLSAEECKKYHTPNTKRMAEKAKTLLSLSKYGLLNNEAIQEYKNAHDLLVSFIQQDILKRFIAENAYG